MLTMNKYLEKIAVLMDGKNSSLSTVTAQNSTEIGGLTRPLSATEKIKSNEYTPPTKTSLEKRLGSDDLNYKSMAKKDIY